jgi:hypothetical protein
VPLGDGGDVGAPQPGDIGEVRAVVHHGDLDNVARSDGGLLLERHPRQGASQHPCVHAVDQDGAVPGHDLLRRGQRPGRNEIEQRPPPPRARSGGYVDQGSRLADGARRHLADGRRRHLADGALGDVVRLHVRPLPTQRLCVALFTDVAAGERDDFVTGPQLVPSVQTLVFHPFGSPGASAGCR